MKRTMAALLCSALAFGGMAACKAEPSSSGAKGTVVKKEKDRRHKCSVFGCYDYDITVKEDSGRRDKGGVSEEVYNACQVGDRWPACKKGAKR